MFRTAALLAAVLLPASLQAQLDTTKLTAIIDDTHKAGNFDGVVIVSEGGRPVLIKAIGEANKTTHQPNSPETVFRLASLTKQITSLLVMQQVQEGRIRLDQPAGELLPALPAATSGRVTIRQLLTHVSGLPNPSDGPDNVIPAFYTRQGAAAIDMAKDATGFCSGPVKRPAGTSFEYNNCDYLVLGAILESVTGKPFAEQLRTRITQPLGLKSWGIWPADPTRAPKSVAQGYQVDGTPDLPQNPATYGAAGALYGNALDVAKWDEALLHHTLLSAESTEIMFHADPKLYGEALGSWSYDLPGTKPALHLVERQGDIGGTRLLNLLLPQSGVSIVILSNTERTDLFDTYSKKGLGYELARACAGN